MNDMQKAMLLSLVRGGLVAVAGSHLSDGDATTIASALVIVLTMAWGAFQKFEAEKAAQSRESVAMQQGAASVGAADPAPSITSQGKKP